jgi:methionyl-tRNA formyltransferase
MRILFIGTVEFSYKTLEKLISLDAEIVGVCTKEKSSFNSDFADLVPLCEKASVPCRFVDDINSSENIAWIGSLEPDIVFCFGWSSLIRNELLSLPKMGIVGYHPAALSQNRGRHPLIWAMVLGLKKSASTFFFMQEGADDGDILSQKEFDILYEDNAKSLYDKVSSIALKQIEEFLPQLQSGNYKKIIQNHALANSWRKRSKADGIIDFRMSSRAIYNLVRALGEPYVGATLRYKDEEITIWQIEEVDCDLPNIEYGKVLANDGKTITIKTSDKAIRITDHEFKQLPQIGEYL